MADFDLVAKIRGSFDNIKRQAKSEQLEMPVQEQGGTAGGGGAAAGGAGGMMRLLGTIAVAAGVITALLEPLKPMMEMLSGIMKILGMFLVPVMMMLMPVLTAIMKFLTQVLGKWMDLNLSDKVTNFMERAMADIGRTIQNALPDWIPGVNNQQEQQQQKNTGHGLALAGMMTAAGSPLGLGMLGMQASNWMSNQVSDLFSGNEEGGGTTNINVQGLTTESVARKLEMLKNEGQKENLG